MRYWEEIRDGDIFECGQHTISLDEIAGFARAWDPQPFHCDAASAKESVYRGCVASGFHTLSLCNRLAYDSFMKDVASMGATALDDARWIMPVRPDDTLKLRVQVIEKIASRTKPDRGIIRFRYELSNARHEAVATMVITEVVERREQA